ncbi:MAG: DUF4214 domain-containing protein [Chlorobiaceae bacterium]
MSVNTKNIQQLYVAYFGRPADVLGLAYWENVVAAANGNIQAVSSSFAASAEYKATFAGLNTMQIVNAVYNNLFHRDAEPGGLLYWSNLLAQGAITIDNVVTQIANGAQTTDKIALADKVDAAVNFTNAMVTTAQILSYNGTPALAIAKSWLAGIYDATSETTALASLDTTIASLATAATPQTLTLTTGVDTINPTGYSNTVGVLGAAGTATLTTFDTIAATGSGNTLTLTDTRTGSATTLPTNLTITGVQNAVVQSTQAVGVVGSNSVNSAAFDVSGWTGLTSLNVSASTGGNYIKAAVTTNVNVADSAGEVAVNGGKDVTVVTTVGDIAVGYLLTEGTASTTGGTAAKGAVNVTTTGATGAVGVNGGTSVTTTSEHDVTIAGATGAVTVSNTGLGNGIISIQGGTTVNYALTAAHTSTGTVTIGPTSLTRTYATVTTPDILTAAYATGNVVVNNSFTAADGTTITYGTGATGVYTNGATSVSITGGGAATVVDANTYARHLTNSTDTAAAGTSVLSTVSLNHIGAASTIASSALTNVSLTNSAYGVTDTVVGAHTLAITSAGNSSVAGISDATATSFAITTSGAKATTADTLVVAGAHANNISVANTTGAFTLGSISGVGTDSTITAIAVSASGNGTTVLGDLTNAKVTSVDASAATGAVSATIDATKATYAGGIGNDTLTISAVPTKAISGGIAGVDTLILNALGSAPSSGTPVFISAISSSNKVSGFDVLGLGTAANGTYDGSGFATLSIANAVADAVTFNNLDGNNTLNMSAAPGYNVTLTYADPSSTTSDALTFNVGTATGTGLNTYTLGTAVTANGIENVTVHSLGTGTGTNVLHIADNHGLTLTIDGAEALTLAAASTAFSTIDVSAALKAVDVSAVAVAATGVTITGGAGLLTAIGGAGVDHITTGAGGGVITGGTGADVINLTAASTAVAVTLNVADADSLYNSYDVVSGFNVAATVASDILHFTAGASIFATASGSTNITGVTFTNTGGVIAFAGPSLGGATLASLIGAAEALVDTAAAVSGHEKATAAFQFGTDTYVVHAGTTIDAAHDSVVELVGVTGVVALTTGSTLAAHTILLG